MSLRRTIEAAVEYLAPEKIDYVIYHSPCSDGSGAALGAWLKLKDNAVYEGMTYHTPINLEKLKGKNVIFLDCSLKKDELVKLRSIANKVMILDHHASAEQELAGEAGCFFFMGNSGAILAWHYFHGIDVLAPQLLRLIEDRDLWRWDNRELSEPLYYAIIAKFPKVDYKALVPYLQEDKLNELIAFGRELVSKNQLWCQATARAAKFKNLNLPDGKKYRVICQELENNKLISELAEYLYTNNEVDLVMLWFKVAGDRFKISFRTNNKAVNLATLASSLGGGGHEQAAGAVLNYSPWQLLTD